MKNGLSIAGLNFEAREGFDTEPINSYFQSFWNCSAASDLACKISVSADANLASDAKAFGEPWAFTCGSNSIIVQRRNEDGCVIWQYELDGNFQSAHVKYVPELFENHYFSVEDLLCRDVGMSLIVMGLHDKGGLLFHGSASVVDGQGVLCVGQKGAGKTTIATLLSLKGATVLSDEHPIARRWPLSGDTAMNTGFRVYGSPWPSSGGYVCNDWAPLKRIYFLRHGLENEIIPTSPSEAAAEMIRVITVPTWNDERLFDPCLKTAEKMVSAIPAAVLSFRPDEEVVDLIRQDLATERVIV